MSELKLSKFLELLNKCDKNCKLEIITPDGSVIDDWKDIHDIVQIDKNHVINYYKASSMGSKEKIVQIRQMIIKN